jgi:hypothetical protein
MDDIQDFKFKKNISKQRIMKLIRRVCFIKKCHPNICGFLASDNGKVVIDLIFDELDDILFEKTKKKGVLKCK